MRNIYSHINRGKGVIASPSLKNLGKIKIVFGQRQEKSESFKQRQKGFGQHQIYLSANIEPLMQVKISKFTTI